MNKDKKFDIYQKVTEQIITLLENHEAGKYQKTWFSAAGEIFANNPTSGHQYNGLNQICLSILINENSYTQNRWMTFKQGQQHGANVKKGEKSEIVSYYSRKYLDEKGKNITKQCMQILKEGHKLPEGVQIIPFVKYYPVFNLNQFENVPEELLFKGEAIQYNEPEKNDMAEEVLNGSGAKIEYKRFQDTIITMMGAGSPNYYNPKSDKIILAERQQFTGTESFYKTAFHELGHWTGHKSRMNRDMTGQAGSESYALEELTAELFTAFMSARLGFNSQITNNAAYIKSWLTCLDNDKKFIFTAAAQAQKAVSFVCERISLKIQSEAV